MANPASAIARAVSGRSMRIATFDVDLRRETGQWYLADRVPLSSIVEDFAGEDAFDDPNGIRVPLHEEASAALTDEFLLVDPGKGTVSFHDPNVGRSRTLPIAEIERTVPAWRVRFWTDAFEAEEPAPFRQAAEDDPADVPSVPDERSEVAAEAFFEAVRSELVSMRDRRREEMRATFSRIPVEEYLEEHGGLSDVNPAGRSVDEYGQQVIELTLPANHPLADATEETLASRTGLRPGDEIVVASPTIDALPVEAELFAIDPDGLEIGVYWDSARGTEAEDAFDASTDAVFTVGKLVDGRRFGTVAAAIDTVARTEHANARYVGREETGVGSADVEIGTDLNREQRAAVTRAVASETEVLCVQSPPWSGVRRTMGETVRRAVAREERVLVLSPDAGTLGRLLGEDRSWLESGGLDVHVALPGNASGSPREAADVVAVPIGATESIPDHAYDLAVVDQAARVDVPTGAVAFAKAARVVLFGDPWQGSPPHALDDPAEAVARSIFDHLLDAERSIRLRTQYRMHRAITQFPNERFYDGALVNAPRNRGWRIAAMDPLDAHHVDENVRTTPTGSVYHDEEIDRVVDEVAALHRRGVEPEDIGVLTPYSAQVGKIRVALEEQEAGSREAVLVGGLDAFRCRSRAAVIVSFVGGADPDRGLRGEAAKFVEPAGLNVALTRAEKRLVLVGDWSSIAERGDHHEALASFLRDRGLLA